MLSTCMDKGLAHQDLGRPARCSGGKAPSKSPGMHCVLTGLPSSQCKSKMLLSQPKYCFVTACRAGVVLHSSRCSTCSRVPFNLYRDEKSNVSGVCDVAAGWLHKSPAACIVLQATEAHVARSTTV